MQRESVPVLHHTFESGDRAVAMPCVSKRFEWHHEVILTVDVPKVS
jgi:hypothetical protein